jgi:hypothetical protein
MEDRDAKEPGEKKRGISIPLEDWVLDGVSAGGKPTGPRPIPYPNTADRPAKT